jgi:catechol 2,3-dioxygenase-like lactoylglutathione lyase family enzyme
VLAYTVAAMTSPIQNRIGNVFIPVSDMRRSIEWYSRVLGYDPGPTSHDGTIHDIPTVGETGLALDANRPAFDPDGPPRFFWWTEDLRATYSFLDSLGVELASEIEDIGSVAFLQFRDPDGNLLMVCQSL